MSDIKFRDKDLLNTFAVAALSSMTWSDWNKTEAAKDCYDMAEAMLEQSKSRIPKAESSSRPMVT